MASVFRRVFSLVITWLASIIVSNSSGDLEMSEQARERNQGESGGDNTAGDGSRRAGGEADADDRSDCGAVQTAAVGWTGYAITLVINLPRTVDPHLQLAYDAHVAFLCVTFFAAVYAVSRSLFKEEREAATAAVERHRCRKMMVLISVSAAISFALRIYIAAASWWRVLLISAAASVLGWLYLRLDVSRISCV